jgi:hypothetical protein
MASGQITKVEIMYIGGINNKTDYGEGRGRTWAPPSAVLRASLVREMVGTNQLKTTLVGRHKVLLVSSNCEMSSIFIDASIIGDVITCCGDSVFVHAFSISQTETGEIPTNPVPQLHGTELMNRLVKKVCHAARGSHAMSNITSHLKLEDVYCTGTLRRPHLALKTRHQAPSQTSTQHK